MRSRVTVGRGPLGQPGGRLRGSACGGGRICEAPRPPAPPEPRAAGPSSGPWDPPAAPGTDGLLRARQCPRWVHPAVCCRSECLGRQNGPQTPCKHGVNHSSKRTTKQNAPRDGRLPRQGPRPPAAPPGAAAPPPRAPLPLWVSRGRGAGPPRGESVCAPRAAGAAPTVTVRARGAGRGHITPATSASTSTERGSEHAPLSSPSLVNIRQLSAGAS